MKKSLNSRLIVLFGVVFVLFHYPFISLFNEDELVFGIPPFILYILFLWVGITLFSFFISRKRSHGD